MTLTEFMTTPSIRNQWIQHPEFDSLYLRKSKRYFKIHGRIFKVEHVLEIASIKAKQPGHGSFQRLINKLLTTYPEYVIYVENALTERFRNHLRRIGFVPDEIVGLEDSLLLNWEQYS